MAEEYNIDRADGMVEAFSIEDEPQNTGGDAAYVAPAEIKLDGYKTEFNTKVTLTPVELVPVTNA